MYAPRVFISMLGTLIVFAVATYFLTDSLWTTFIETIICAVLLQTGYFLGVLYLVWKERKSRHALLSEDSVLTSGQEDTKIGGLSTSNFKRSEPFNP
ncbi:exopolysaccharide production repressor exox [Rhizobium sp. P40RR-XXII]|uniref:exopolysaccharide production repressor protein n=1 Tax=unclassified Rhizobium TaxID=2613769 RepID=UPI0014577FD5|nr:MULTISPECIES: exopolysaccharide production repressor protein [unclassified Rhizobium]NLR84634.1 exopolysaccharide production repressor exox [Rhizobium sp. P28RR-XV]NLS16459.1 exopolysaccharide production repressor exox [Rhizobium sp. P40RR-XXII]